MKEGFLRSSRYSPGNMDRQSLEALFVGRGDVMNDVLDRVTKSISSPQKHYMLMVGPRGSGKTHFLVLAYHRLLDWLTASDAQDKVIVALLKEEEWGVASFLDFIVRILKSLADQTEGLRAQIAEIQGRFSKDPAEAESFALALLRQHSQGKTLLLLCENLVDLFDGLAEEGQKRWRAIMQEDGNWAIVATTPSLFAAVSLQDNPFYGFFTIRTLEQIDFETALELLAKKAIHENKLELAEFLRTPIGRARARAIHHLAAGNHRAYVVLFRFLDKESLQDLVVPFMDMVDELTPYYQDRIRQLAPAQRKIVEALCLQREPSIVKDIATSCLMSQQTAASQIRELRTRGFVNAIPNGRNTFCEISEPLMRICFEVKDGGTQHFRLFVEFLRHWFTSKELKSRKAAFGVDTHAADRIHVEEAIRCSLAEGMEPLVNALHFEADKCWKAGNYQGLATIQEKLVSNVGDAEDYRVWILALVEMGDTHAAVQAGREGAAKHPDHARIQYWLAQALLREDLFNEAASAINRAISIGGEHPPYLCLRADVLLRLDQFDLVIRDARAVLRCRPDHWHSYVQMVRAAVGMRRWQDAEAYAKELLQLAPQEPTALLTAARLHASRDQLDSALELVDRALDIDADHQAAHRMRGFILFDLSDYGGACAELRSVASLYPNSVPIHCHLADSLLHVGEWSEAIEVAEHLLDIDPTHSHAHAVRGEAMVALGRPEDAIAAFDELLPSTDSHALLLAASSARGIEDYPSAKRYLDRVTHLKPDDRRLWVERTRLAIDIGDFQAASKSANRVAGMPGAELKDRLLATQIAAGTEPLHTALEKAFGTAIGTADFEKDEEGRLEAMTGMLFISLKSFGPLYLAEGLARIPQLLADGEDEGAMGRILTDFLMASVDEDLPGSLADWELALDDISTSLADRDDCGIPIEMLRVAVKCVKAGDRRPLLDLPLEQRQLLEDILPPPE